MEADRHRRARPCGGPCRWAPAWAATARSSARSANVVLSDISKKFGHEITFMQFFKRGFPIMLFTVAIAAIYMVIRFPGG